MRTPDGTASHSVRRDKPAGNTPDRRNEAREPGNRTPDAAPCFPAAGLDIAERDGLGSEIAGRADSGSDIAAQDGSGSGARSAEAGTRKHAAREQNAASLPAGREPRPQAGTAPEAPPSKPAFCPHWIPSSQVSLPAPCRKISANPRHRCWKALPSDPAVERCCPASPDR
jgi:hypothetical protein